MSRETGTITRLLDAGVLQLDQMTGGQIIGVIGILTIGYLGNILIKEKTRNKRKELEEKAKGI